MSDQSLNKLGSVTTIGAGDFIGIHKTGSGLRKCAGSNFMDLVPAGSTNVHITAYEKAKLAESTNVRWLIGTDSDSDNNNITDAHAYRDWETDRKSTRLNSSHITRSRMPSSA